MQYTLMYDKLHLSLAGSNGIAAHVYFRRSAYPLVWEWAILMVGSSTVTCVSPAIVGRIRGLSFPKIVMSYIPLMHTAFAICSSVLFCIMPLRKRRFSCNLDSCSIPTLYTVR
ncbi:hypothetical protein ASPTUDRAFT_492034 [Aspergillus tubingensis CBS 134.48]|uniref:Uncharacterized protein n=1 Tax=Aspergillus tubingensis (strain CBS 134.48) TaxID=767770 RepID=A0A1L9NC90_ASPTC|nr:hypothetical protein ASPTUDRAFT_492034 [Aspergillus tubingensis CBS 134.48]